MSLSLKTIDVISIKSPIMSLDFECHEESWLFLLFSLLLSLSLIWNETPDADIIWFTSRSRSEVWFDGHARFRSKYYLLFLFIFHRRLCSHLLHGMQSLKCISMTEESVFPAVKRTLAYSLLESLCVPWKVKFDVLSSAWNIVHNKWFEESDQKDHQINPFHWWWWSE